MTLTGPQQDATTTTTRRSSDVNRRRRSSSVASPRRSKNPAGLRSHSQSRPGPEKDHKKLSSGTEKKHSVTRRRRRSMTGSGHGGSKSSSLASNSFRTVQTVASTESSWSPSSEANVPRGDEEPHDIFSPRKNTASMSSSQGSAQEKRKTSPPKELTLPPLEKIATKKTQPEPSIKEEPCEHTAAVIREEEASLERFQQMLQRDDLTSIDQINLLYALGRLSAKMGRYEQALEYHQAELELTQEVVDETAKQGTVGAVVVAKNAEGGEEPEAAHENDAVARVLDGMARIAKQGLGNLDLAMNYHKEAMKIRQALHGRILEEAKQCRHCASRRQTHGSTAFCRMHGRALRDTVKTMEETKQNMGRILFEQGQVNQAVQLITKLAPPSSAPSMPPASPQPVSWH